MLIVELSKTFQRYLYYGESLETIAMRKLLNPIGKPVYEFVKCLTFFNQDEWKNFQIILNTIRINLLFAAQSFPYRNNYQFSIHSPNNLPEYSLDVDFEHFDFTQTTTVKYYEYRVKRLGKGYDTDCYDYESENKFKYYRMRSDCVTECYQNKMRQLCKVEHGYFMSQSLLRIEYLDDRNDRLISCYDTEYDHINFTIKQDCEKMCKVECNFKYYSNEINSSKDFEGKIFVNHNHKD